ncbi:MAG: UDP-N-acetylmuramoyl-L-alanine--D-glutamate ligase [Ilumatobacter sp.]|jgi:UDP-N-acetylmuramoylalanine--D-glutamate ligase|uniref:UDP-N-acetylmuramoyl-L-alanine--D-glutamate ligase n=1 Tax=Ilumatobacter sp. TaxID=1967498 RepID=UPI001DB2AC93|nr:UDP-N-acetylmuramoyl-L-alanine--D-glutamate ligase [Ilumatobacter sp.]MBT5277273.1 UDP-N-acetylmuramoyl-L-alanine--D-glutamate ligase [Ilumatobacter sp.]MBT5553096.1 UDP-N-acetylmuramoyl-L-alanine--D-glutamate ligase [Ilumatobacter sp.]MBT5863954.1 UDP-N-acetylmuramoyl-L-alanine--D-glutamate ligase [Ilumatobacter sp.]MDG0977463.1 UDP-N-acetylmuramoyl-L-alanine--D-glutamate ligase [Ilumatobacter sp.]
MSARPDNRPKALVYGLAVAGVSTVRALLRHGHDVIAADDTITPERLATATELGVELIDSSVRSVDELLDGCSMLCPAPGVPETHPIIEAALARGIEIVSEIELAYRWEQQRPGGPRRMLAVTATDGKTTTSKLAVHLLEAAGVRSIDAGNTDTPLVDALDAVDEVGNERYDAFVVECSSFRLAWTPTFRADAAAWLNLQPDHLNWHRSMNAYEAAKAQVFANQTAADVAIGFAEDPVVMAWLAQAPGRQCSFGGPDADYRVENATLVGPNGTIAPLRSLRRRLPHDVTNALAASALVLETGLADAAAVASGLATFVGPPHRLERIATINGIDWYNDSKATTPHAAAAAIRSFERIVLIAGGADKGVALSSMAAEPERFAGVIGLGATAPNIVELFIAAGVNAERVVDVQTLERAVTQAAEWAGDGDVVLLSPGCASLDQFASFEVRGDTFRRLVAALSQEVSA